jgi:hypothetical protein
MLQKNTFQKASIVGVAILYLFFSCFYVTRCIGVHAAAPAKKNSFFKNREKLTSQAWLRNGAGKKAIPIAFLSRPRVIFSKNGVSVTPASVISLFVWLFDTRESTDINNAIVKAKIPLAQNILPKIRNWRI